MIYCSETKVEDTYRDSDIVIYIRSDTVTSQNNVFLKESKKISLKFFYLKPRQYWLELFTDGLSKIILKTLTKTFPSINTKEKYSLGEFQISIYEINKHNFHENNIVCTKLASADAKKYHPFCAMHGLKQITQSPNPVTCSTSTRIDHRFASLSSRVSQ